MAPPLGWKSNRLNDLTHRVFGRLTVVKRGSNFKNVVGWECKCVCGNVKNVRASSLIKGWTTSCGCYHRDMMRETHSTHGMAGKPEYQAWNHMIQRCYNERTCNYSNYGGRGITVCTRWRTSFKNFLDDMGLKPSRKHSIDRIDNNKGYFKENCRWSGPYQQASNKRDTVNITFQGETKCLKEWARSLNMSYKNLHKRIFIRGWTVDRAFSVLNGNKCKLLKTKQEDWW